MKKYLITKVDYLAKTLPDNIMALHERHKQLFYLDTITKAAMKEIQPEYTPDEFSNLKSWLYMAGHIKADQEEEAKKQALIDAGWSPLTPEYIEAVYNRGVKKIEVCGSITSDWFTHTLDKKIYKPWYGKAGAFIMSPKAKTRGTRIAGFDNLFAREVK